MDQDKHLMPPSEEAKLCEIRDLLAEQTGQSPETITDEQVRIYLQLSLAEYETDDGISSIQTLFERQVEQTPETVAMVHRDQHWTCAELNQHANRLAHYLRRRGVGPEVRVAIFLERSLDFIVAILGILKAGGAYVPLDPADPDRHVRTLLAEVQPSFVLTRSDILSRLGDPTDGGIALDWEWEAIAEEKKSNPTWPTSPSDLAYVLRRVQVEHRSIWIRLQWLQTMFGLSSLDAVLCKASAALDTMVWEIFWPLVNGARLVLADVKDQDAPEYLKEIIVEQTITVIHFVPSALAALLASCDAESVSSLGSLRAVLCSGEPFGQAVTDAFFQRFSCSLYNMYAPPEAAMEVTVHSCQLGYTGDIMPIGRPTTMAVYVLDEHLHPLPVGVSGEICIAGKGLARGYLHDIERTAQRFVVEPSIGRLFKTGDIGRRLSDGTLELLGAVGRHVWVRGSRVELGKVEQALLEDPLVAECFVLAREMSNLSPEIVAYFVPNGSFSTEYLHKRLQQALPAAMCPSTYVAVNALPLTSAGQVDEQALGRMEIIDSRVIHCWKEHLSALPEIKQFVVLSHRRPARRSPLHLSDLIPDWKPGSIKDEEFAAAEVVQESHEERPNTSATVQSDTAPVIACADGGPLVIANDAPKTLAEALVQTAQRYPGKGIRYVHSDGTEELQSYTSLLQEAKCVLSGLYANGLRSGDWVILQLDALRDHFTTFWACILGGIVPATVAIAPSYKERNGIVNKLYNTWQLLEHPTIIASVHLVEPISHLQNVMPMQGVKSLSIRELKAFPPADRIHPSQPTDMVFFQLTSGSTGMPKCIQETHRAIISHIHGSKQFNDYTSDDVCLNWLPVDHVVPILTFHLKDVYLGCQEIQVKTQLILADPLKWLDLIEAHRVTHTWSPNFGFKLVSDCFMQVRDRTWNLSSIKFFMNAGEQVTLPVVRDFLNQVAPFGVPQRAMQPSFGMAEACTCMTYQNHFDIECGVHHVLKSSLGGQLQKVDSDDTQTISFVDLGPVMPGVQIRITDQDNRLVPEGVIGRFQIKGDVITPGYLNNDAANQEAFVGDGWFNSGDLGFILNGQLILTGREKEMIIIRGVNFYCYEIEDVVNAIEGVEPTYVAACAVSDPSTGSEEVAIFFVPKVVTNEEKMRLIGTIRYRVTFFLGITPLYVIPLDQKDFPKTTSGKIQRIQFKKSLLAGDFRDLLKEIDLYLRNANTLPDWFYQKIWRRKEMFHGAVSAPLDRALVFLDEEGLGQCMCVELGAQKVTCVQVEAGPGFAKRSLYDYSINPREPEHYRQLLASLKKDGISIAQVVHLWTYGKADPIVERKALEMTQYRGVYSLLFLIQAIHWLEGTFESAVSLDQSIQLHVISSQVQPTSPNDQLVSERSTLIGLLKTIPLELSELHCRHIDLEDDLIERNVVRVVKELSILKGDPEVAYRNGRRLVSTLEKVSMLQQETWDISLKTRGLYLVAGGLGGIGTCLAQFLMREYQARLLLIGRTVLSDSTIDSTEILDPVLARRIRDYRALEATGGEFAYKVVDVCDLAGLQRAVTQAEARWGEPLTGIIHLAGEGHLERDWQAIEKHWLTVEKPQRFESMFRAKVYGTWTLFQLIQDKPDVAFFAFSSVNGVFGGAGFGAYSAANSFLDTYTLYRRYRTHPRAFCLNWTIWTETGMSEGIPGYARDAARRTGYELISREQGVNSFLAALYRNQPQLIIGLDEGNTRIRQYLGTECYPLKRLVTVFTTNGTTAPLAQLQDIIVPDRFGTRTECAWLPVQQMPLSPDGQVDLQQLQSLEAGNLSDAIPYVPPQTEIEKTIVDIWRGVLHVPRIGRHSRFFDLGGHSLLATQVISRLQEAFQVEIPLQALFEKSTVAGLAEHIEEERRAERGLAAPPIERVERDGKLPLSFAQEQLWFLDQLVPNNPFYNVPVAIQLWGQLDVAAMEQALNEIVRRHEVLRTVFEAVDGRPVQVIAPAMAVKLPVVDLGGVSDKVREVEAQRLTGEEAQRPFDLARGPLLRVTLLRLGEEDHALLLTIHHIVSDGWSMGVLVQEATALYGAFSRGGTVSLPELPIQYADYAVWQRKWLQGDVLEEQLAYWKGQLMGAPTVLELPADRPRPSLPSYRGASLPFELSKSLSQKLKDLGQQERATPFIVLLAGFGVLLHRYTGQEDVLIGAPVANRNRKDIEGLVGLFANSLVLRVNTAGNPTFRELLRRVREMTLEAYVYRDLPFEVLVETLRPERALSHMPLVQVALVLLNAPMEPFELPDLVLNPLEFETGVSRADLEFQLWDSPKGFQGRLQYNTDIFEPSTIIQILDHFRVLLREIAARPEWRLLEIPLSRDKTADVSKEVSKLPVISQGEQFDFTA